MPNNPLLQKAARVSIASSGALFVVACASCCLHSPCDARPPDSLVSVVCARRVCETGNFFALTHARDAATPAGSVWLYKKKPVAPPPQFPFALTATLPFPFNSSSSSTSGGGSFRRLASPTAYLVRACVCSSVRRGLV